MTVWSSIKSGLIKFSATTRDTFGCTGNNRDAIDDDDNNNYVTDNNGKGLPSQLAFVEIDFLRSDLNHQRRYPDNSIRTAKYTLASALPLSLLCQFYKISNFYFLLVVIVSLVPGASPINPFSSVVPLCVVLGAGIIKDLWEDWKRRKADKQANEMIVHVLRVPLQPDKSVSHSKLSRSRAIAAAAATQGEGAPTTSTKTEITGSGTTDGKNNNSSGVKIVQARCINSNNMNLTSDSDERNNSVTVAVADRSAGGPSAQKAADPPDKERKRKHFVHFLFPSEKLKSRNSVEAADGNSSPGCYIQMSAFEKEGGLTTASATSQPPILKTDLADAAAPPALTRSATSASHTARRKEGIDDNVNLTASPSPGTAAADEATANAKTLLSPSHESKVTFQPIRSCDVYPGDIVLFRLGEEVKADCLILNTSLPDGLTYIETANLDGETNAKTRRAKIQTVEALGTVEDIIEQSLGVPATNAAAVFAKMNGVDLTNVPPSTTRKPPTKVTVDSCNAVGMHVVSSPEQEARNTMTVAACAQSGVVVSVPESEALARHTTPLRSPRNVEEKCRLLSRASSFVSGAVGIHDPSADSYNVNNINMSINQRINDGNNDNGAGAPRDGEDPYAVTASATTHHLEREEREAAEAAVVSNNKNNNQELAVSYHRRSLWDPTQLRRQSSNTASPRTTLPFTMSGTDLAGPSASESLFALQSTSANGTPAGLALDRVHHHRHLTLDERLMEKGAIPIPLHVRELSAQYERAVHSRTSSLGLHQGNVRLSSSRLLRQTAGEEAGSVVCVDEGESLSPRRNAFGGRGNGAIITNRTPNALATPFAGDRGRAVNSACATVRNCDKVTGAVTQMEDISNTDYNDENTDAVKAGYASASTASSGVVLVSCAPTPDLSTWFGQLRMPSGEMVPLGVDQFIPRGCLIRNTDWVLGAVVYTGRHTKMLLNLRPKPNKITNMNRRLNQLNAFLFLMNQMLMFLLCGLSIWSKHYMLRQVPGAKTEFAAWYIQWSLTRHSDATLFWWRYLTNFVLLSYLIPMSLYVTLEFNKAMQMLIIGADKRMAVYDEFTGDIKKARPKTSELNCQLGHVRYIFTDKTGTLTENLMTYVGGVVDGYKHSEVEQPGGIGRALLKRCGTDGKGGGANEGSGTFNNNSNFYLDGDVARRRVPSVNDAIGCTTAVTPQHSLSISVIGHSDSATRADGGETPNATTTTKAKAFTHGADAQKPRTGSALRLLSSAGNNNMNNSPVSHRHSRSVDSPNRFITQAEHINNDNNSTSMPAFGTLHKPLLYNHILVDSDMGPPAPGTGTVHCQRNAVTGGSAYQWGSGTFNAFGSHGGSYMSANSANFGGGNGGAGNTCGLRNVNEAVLECDPLFRYLRALALCHSVVCFPLDEQSSAATETMERDTPNRTQEEVEVEVEQHPSNGRDHASDLTKAERDQRRQERKAKRKARRELRKQEVGDRDGTAGTAQVPEEQHSCHHRSREEKEGSAAQKDAEKHHRHHHKHSHHRGSRDMQEPCADVHSTHVTVATGGGRTHSRVSSAVGLPPVSSIVSLSNIAGGNFVEIPYAVPAGPQRDGYEPYTQSADVTAAGVENDDNEPVTAASSAALAVRAAHARSASLTPTLPPLTTQERHHSKESSVFQTHPPNSTKLHGRTSSASWYQNRYFNRVMHSRNFSANSNVSLRARVVSKGGGPNPSYSNMNSRVLRNNASASVAEDTNNMAGRQVPGGLELFIDRSKIYEGQSLDEIALVNAARENGFSLFERTAKQMYVKALGRIMCYDIIAELEFTPQRKLMSILLQRRVDLDSESAASSAAAGTKAHYHRRAEEHLDAARQAAAGAPAVLLSGNNVSLNASNNNNDSSAHFQPIGSSRHSGYDPVQTRTVSYPFTPDATALGASPTKDLEGANFSSSAAVDRRPHNSSKNNNYNSSAPLLTTESLPQSPIQTNNAAAAAGQHPQSGNALNTSSPRPQLQSSVGDLASIEHNNDNSKSAGGFASAPVADSCKYLLLVKGADSSVMEIVNMQKKANAREKEKMLSELGAMAHLGLRTLVFGQRYVSEEEVLAWLPIFNEAQCAMQNRNEKLHQAYALLEKDVDIVGTTAVEDKLQDEVPQTLEFCIQASIVVWMLTGDKRETAVTIGHTSGLVSQDCTDYVCHLDVSDIVEEEALLKQQEQYEERARARKANSEVAGDSGIGSEEEEEGEKNVDGEKSKTSNQPTDSINNLNANSTSMSMEINSATQPLPGLSSDTRSPGPQSARTAAGHVDNPVQKAYRGILSSGLADRKNGGAGMTKDDAEAATTAAGARTSTTETAASQRSATSLMKRKVARIESQLLAAEKKCAEGEEVFGTHVVVIVVDGKTLDFIFQDNARARRFFMLGSRCRSAVCCRMTPLQKAKIVRMFKRNTNAVALAIGDGANDVSMIQESSIGVGIMGLEGSQAELASDYAIPKFRFLKRLLFVHGRFSVFREAHCIVYSLYKNVIVMVGMVAYQFYSCYSGMSLMDSWLLAMFSIFFCSLQPLMIGILDKDVEDELAESLPKLYPPLSREFMYFSFPYIGKWLLDGVIEGLIFFFVLMYTVGVQDNLYPHMTPAIEDYGTTFFTMLVLVADFRVGALVTYYMILFALAVFLEIIFVPIIEIVYSAMNNLAGSNWCVKTANELYSTSGKFWLMLLFACGVLVVVTMASNMYIQLFYPWQNAGFAMRAARASGHRVPYNRLKKELKKEYVDLLARYEALRQRQVQAAGQLNEEENGGSPPHDLPTRKRSGTS